MSSQGPACRAGRSGGGCVSKSGGGEGGIGPTLGALRRLRDPRLPCLSFLRTSRQHGPAAFPGQLWRRLTLSQRSLAPRERRWPSVPFCCHARRPDPAHLALVPQVPYARSEAHLTELLERVCEKMKEYGEKVDPSTHRKSYVRVISHDGTKMDLSGVKIDGDVASSLKFAVRAGAGSLGWLSGLSGGFGWRDPLCWAAAALLGKLEGSSQPLPLILPGAGGKEAAPGLGWRGA